MTMLPTTFMHQMSINSNLYGVMPSDYAESESEILNQEASWTDSLVGAYDHVTSVVKDTAAKVAQRFAGFSPVTTLANVKEAVVNAVGSQGVAKAQEAGEPTLLSSARLQASPMVPAVFGTPALAAKLSLGDVTIIAAAITLIGGTVGLIKYLDYLNGDYLPRPTTSEKLLKNISFIAAREGKMYYSENIRSFLVRLRYQMDVLPEIVTKDHVDRFLALPDSRDYYESYKVVSQLLMEALNRSELNEEIKEQVRVLANKIGRDREQIAADASDYMGPW